MQKRVLVIVFIKFSKVVFGPLHKVWSLIFILEPVEGLFCSVFVIAAPAAETSCPQPNLRFRWLLCSRRR